MVVFPNGKNTVEMIDAATGQVVQQHHVKGTHGYGASVQRKVAAMAVCGSQNRVYLMEIVSGNVLFTFIPPNGKYFRVALSKDALALAVGTSTGL